MPRTKTTNTRHAQKSASEPWNQERVRQALMPFKEIADDVPDNRRTSYTEAGGRRIGRQKDDPESLWVNTYCGIKTPRINAVFACNIRREGEEPDLYLEMNKQRVHTFKPTELPKALAIWRDIAAVTIEATSLAVEFQSSVLKSLQLPSSERKRRLARAQKLPRKILVVTEAFIRNPDVIAEVLERAQGVCEHLECQQPAPFRRAKDGTPYLEVHHRVKLADGGEDTVENAIALCPNCHRKAHFG